MISNFKLYQHRYRYDEEEMTYFLLKLVMVDKIDIYKVNLSKTIILVNFFGRLKCISGYVI